MLSAPSGGLFKTDLIIESAVQSYEQYMMQDIYRMFSQHARIIANEARGFAPMGKTGKLKRSIVYQINERPKGRGLQRFKAYVGISSVYDIRPNGVVSNAVDYARRVEFGYNWTRAIGLSRTKSGRIRRMRKDKWDREPIQAPQPFLTRATMAERGAVMQSLREAGRRWANHRGMVNFTKKVV